MKRIQEAFLRRLAALVTGIALTLTIQASWAQTPQLEKFTLAGWSKPITEITNLLAEPDMGFFRDQGLALNYLPGAGAAMPCATC